MADFTERQLLPGGFKSSRNFNVDKNLSYVEVQSKGKTERVYGTQEQLDQFKQTDQFKQSERRRNNSTESTVESTGVTEGSAAVVTQEQALGAIAEIANGRPPETRSDPQSTYQSPYTSLPNIVPNPLENFASYTPLWTMAVLTPQQFNNPQSYRTDDLSFSAATFVEGQVVGDFDEVPVQKSSIVFSSAGRGDATRTRTLYGSPEYYVENFRMKSVISASVKTGNQNAIGFEFQIHEPHSMGLFLQSLQNAAVKAGYANYLENAPYVLRLDFKGWREDGTELASVKPKYFVMKLTKVTFNVNEGGSIYEVKAVAYNHSGYSDTVNTLFRDLAIEPGEKGLLEELLVTGENSLCAVLNRNEERLVKAGRISIPDVYEIQFPEKPNDFISSELSGTDGSGATKNAVLASTGQGSRKIQGQRGEISGNIGKNPIGQSKFVFDQGQGGNWQFQKESEVIDEETGRIIRDKMSIDPKKRTFHFTQGQSLTQIIDQCILATQFAAKAQDSNRIKDGFVGWYRLDVQTEFLQYDALVGDYARKIIFRVVPFKVHHTVFTNPTTPPVGYDKLQKKIVKVYEYIYTGQNTDVLNFDIEINNLFYTVINPSEEGETKDVVNQNQAGTSETPAQKTPVQTGTDVRTQAASLGAGRLRPQPRRTSGFGGSGTKTTEQKIAESFQKAFIEGSSADLIKVDLTILGDTYWMVDSGVANYFSPAATQTDLITEDGTMNYEGSDVYIYISFRTPADIDTGTGLYEFAKKGQSSVFSGIYKVVRCENVFEDGTFKQVLRCLRMRGQAIDFDNQIRRTSPGTTNMINSDQQKEPATQLTPKEVQQLSGPF
jgi:hypothetical protein